MANLSDNPSFSANEVYEIQATEAVEGAAVGASFGGVGRDNQPHQQLANRTALLKNRQDVNIGNIAALLAFMARFTGSLQQSGYLEVPIADVNRGAVNAIAQWGFIPLIGTDFAPGSPFMDGTTAVKAINFPIAFPNAILLPPLAALGGTWDFHNWPIQSNETGGNLNFPVVSATYSRTGATFMVRNLGIPASGMPALWLQPSQGQIGVIWLALGF